MTQLSFPDTLTEQLCCTEQYHKKYLISTNKAFNKLYIITYFFFFYCKLPSNTFLVKPLLSDRQPHMARVCGTKRTECGLVGGERWPCWAARLGPVIAAKPAKDSVMRDTWQTVGAAPLIQHTHTVITQLNLLFTRKREQRWHCTYSLSTLHKSREKNSTVTVYRSSLQLGQTSSLSTQKFQMKLLNGGFQTFVIWW